MSNRVLRVPWATMLLAVFAMAQEGGPRVTGVEPTTGKAGDTVTVMGENLRQRSLEELLLSRDGENHTTEILERTNDAITIRVPKVSPGDYKLALKIADTIYVEPVGLTVE